MIWCSTQISAQRQSSNRPLQVNQCWVAQCLWWKVTQMQREIKLGNTDDRQSLNRVVINWLHWVTVTFEHVPAETRGRSGIIILAYFVFSFFSFSFLHSLYQKWEGNSRKCTHLSTQLRIVIGHGWVSECVCGERNTGCIPIARKDRAPKGSTGRVR